MDTLVYVFLTSLFWVSVLCFIYFDKKGKQTQKMKKRHISDVKPEEYIELEWDRIKGGIGTFKCINNDPELGKIYLSKRWSNYKEFGVPEFEKVIFSYKDSEVKNFSLLNPVQEKHSYESLMRRFMALNHRMAEVIQNNQLEIAAQIVEEVAKISKLIEKEKNNN